MKLNDRQDVFNAADGLDIPNYTGVYRRCRSAGLTAKQLATFNKMCADKKKRIQWHSKDWVAMDRATYEDLVVKANGNFILAVDESGFLGESELETMRGLEI